MEKSVKYISMQSSCSEEELFAFCIFGLINKLFKGKGRFFYFCDTTTMPSFSLLVLLLRHNLDTVKFTGLKTQLDEFPHMYIPV